MPKKLTLADFCAKKGASDTRAEKPFVRRMFNALWTCATDGRTAVCQKCPEARVSGPSIEENLATTPVGILVREHFGIFEPFRRDPKWLARVNFWQAGPAKWDLRYLGKETIQIASNLPVSAALLCGLSIDACRLLDAWDFLGESEVKVFNDRPDGALTVFGARYFSAKEAERIAMIMPLRT